MTIAVAIRTASAVVFAADSKLTTKGIVGIEEDGSPRLVEQTYDHATKVAHDRSRTLMAMVAGPANIGEIAAADFISMQSILRTPGSNADQNQVIDSLVQGMNATKRTFWEKTALAVDEWPGPTMLLATAAAEGQVPRIWRVELGGQGYSCAEILTEPGIRLEGSALQVFSLLYGYDPTVVFPVVRDQLGIEQARLQEALQKKRVLAPIEKLSLYAMPIQDAIDLAVFLAQVQVQMDRFLPGQSACGGPIDVMVLQVVPEPGILAYPAKALHNPDARR